MNLNTIFFIGPQGSGKGTQARLLAKKLGFFYWEMGGILREVAAQNTELGRNVKSLIDNGVLLDDNLLLQVVKSRLSQIPSSQGVIFDGIPRRLGQAKFLLGYLKEQGRSSFTTMFIDIPRGESIGRLLKRAENEDRKDDTREGIETRLLYYENDTVPVLEFLRNQTIFFEINGMPSVEEVTKEINKELGL